MTSIILQSHLPGQVEVEFQSPGCKLMLLCPRPRSDPLNQNFLVGQYPIFWQFHPFAYFLIAFHANKHVLLKFVLELPVTALGVLDSWMNGCCKQKKSADLGAGSGLLPSVLCGDQPLHGAGLPFFICSPEEIHSVTSNSHSVLMLSDSVDLYCFSAKRPVV